MAYAFLANLADTFGSAREGPDLASLEGILEHLRQHPDDHELVPRIDDLQQRVGQAGQQRRQLLQSRQHPLEASVLQLVEENLAALEGLEQALGSLSQALEAGQAGPSTLLPVEQAAGQLKQSAQSLEELSRSPFPLCPRCAGAGAESICPECGLDRLVPDPMPDLEFQQSYVNEDFMAIFRGYTAVIEGGLAYSAFRPVLLQFAGRLQQAVQDATEAAQSEPEHPAHPRFLAVYQQGLQAIGRMLAVGDHRQTRELHQGWGDLLACAMDLHTTYAELHEYEQEDPDDEILAHLDGDDDED